MLGHPGRWAGHWLREGAGHWPRDGAGHWLQDGAGQCHVAAGEQGWHCQCDQGQDGSDLGPQHSEAAPRPRMSQGHHPSFQLL